MQKKFFYVYVLYISRTYTLFRTFFWTRNRKISYTFYVYVLLIRFMYTLLYTFYVYVIVRENVYVAFLVLLWIFARLSSMTSINSGFFWAEKFLAPQIPVKLEVKSRFSEYIKKVPFDLLLRDWFSAYSDFKFRLKKFIIKTNICSIIIFELEFDSATLSSMTCSSLAMTHPRVEKRCFFFFTIIGEFLYGVPLQISEKF